VPALRRARRAAPAVARLVVGDPRRPSARERCSSPRASGGALLFPHVDFAFLERVGKAHGFDLDTPWRDLSTETRTLVLKGTGEERYKATTSWAGAKYQGKVSFERRYRACCPRSRRPGRVGSGRSSSSASSRSAPVPTATAAA
jgi:excinuclease UvrABC ATPase subunit